MVRLRRRKGTSGLAKSRSQASRLLSVSVTRGGGLKVDTALTRPSARRRSDTATSSDDRARRPALCFKGGMKAARADNSSRAIWVLSKKPWRMT